MPTIDSRTRRVELGSEAVNVFDDEGRATQLLETIMPSTVPLSPASRTAILKALREAFARERDIGKIEGRATVQQAVDPAMLAMAQRNLALERAIQYHAGGVVGGADAVVTVARQFYQFLRDAANEGQQAPPGALGGRR